MKLIAMQIGRKVKEQLEEYLAAAVKMENNYNPRPSKMSRASDGSTIFTWRLPWNPETRPFDRGLLELLQANDDRFGIDYAYKMIVISEDSAPEIFMNESGEEEFSDLTVGISLPKECVAAHRRCGYGIDSAEHPDDEFPGLLEFTRKYTPDVYEGIIRDLGPEPDNDQVKHWFDNYMCSGAQTGVFAHIAHVVNKSEGGTAVKCFGGKIALRNNWIRMNAEKKSWELSNEEFREMVTKYLIQVTDMEYHFDYLDIEGR